MAIYYPNNYQAITVSVLVLTFLNLLYEGMQCVTNTSYYLSDFWNYLDCAGYILMFIYCILEAGEIDLKGKETIFALAIGLVCLRGFAYMRTFETTRYMVGMVNAIVKDMLSFIIVLVYAIFSMACIETILDASNKKPSLNEFGNKMTTHYRLAHGDWSIDEFASDYKLLLTFYASTLILPLILLNLLIALMGDTF